MRLLRVSFFRLPSGREPAREFLKSLSKGDRAKAGALIDELERQGQLAMPKARHLGKGLWEIRFIGEQGKVRIFYCLLVGGILVLLHGIVKKTAKTPKDDLDLARQRKKLVEASYEK